MRNLKTEEERIERSIRSLLKLPENRRCINCNVLGPQYVCTTFSTFVCTNCSGIHREFTHRVKSVSMAKFSPEEVTALQAGGNERAKQIYFKEWDPQRHSYPDSCNIPKLRDFIKHVFVEKRYTGESCSTSLPKIRMSEKQEYYANKKSSSFRLELMSPNSSPHSSPGPRSDGTNVRYLYDESRSPKYAQKYTRNGGIVRSPIKFEVVDNRFRDDEHRKSRLSIIESKLKQISIGAHKNVDKSQLPVAQPLGETLRENAPSLQVSHSGGEDSVEENPSEQKSNNPENFIDLSSEPQSSHVAAGVGPETPPITQSNESNWAIFEASSWNNDLKTPNTNASKPSTTNPLDLLLSELSGPVTLVTDGMLQAPGGANNDPTTATIENKNTWDLTLTSMEQPAALPNNTSVWSITSTPSTELAPPSNEVPPYTEASHAHKPSNMKYLPSISTGCCSTTQPTNSPVKDVATNNQPSVAPNTNDSSCGFTELSSQNIFKPTQETRPDVCPHPNNVETKSIGRKELPKDLFTSSYLSSPTPFAGGWQNVEPQGMGYGMQYYHNAVPPSSLSNAPTSSNPFDVTDGRSLIHSSSLPTMASLQGVPPAVLPRTGLMHASSLGSLGTMMSQSPSDASQVPIGVYFDQVNNKEQPIRNEGYYVYNGELLSQDIMPFSFRPIKPQRANNFNSEITTFGSLNPIQQSGRGNMTPETTNSFSNTGRNPFD